jgi:hypothetical protein
LSGGAVEDACAVGAELTGCTFFVAGTAMSEIYLEIAADARTIGEISGTDTLRISTFFAASTFSAAGTTVIRIGIGIDAGTRTSGLSGGAVVNT